MYEDTKWKKKIFKNKCVNINEDKAHKKISSCTVIMKLNFGNLLHKTKCKRENQSEKISQNFEKKEKTFKI
jgi:hypothetical protein